jgi:hypothetical protein
MTDTCADVRCILTYLQPGGVCIFHLEGELAEIKVRQVPMNIVLHIAVLEKIPEASQS